MRRAVASIPLDPPDGPQAEPVPQAMDLLKTKARVPQHVVYRAFVSETVVLNLETGNYHGLNPTAGRMLEALDSSATVREAAERIAAEYGRPLPDIESDITELCGNLLERGLIELREDEQPKP